MSPRHDLLLSLAVLAERLEVASQPCRVDPTWLNSIGSQTAERRGEQAFPEEIICPFLVMSPDAPEFQVLGPEGGFITGRVFCQAHGSIGEGSYHQSLRNCRLPKACAWNIFQQSVSSFP